jgi:CRISPR system Cascade subunit CasD
MNENPCLLLLLDGPMQAWGYLSFFDRRNSLHYPTRSALLGMFCAAAGIDRSDIAGLQRWDSLRLEVRAYRKRRARIRFQQGQPHVDQDIRLSHRRWFDYHTIGGGYDMSQDRYCIPFSASGKPRGTVVTYREFLADACFVVLVSLRNPQGDHQLLDELCRCLCAPRWGVWLGRKCCIPSFPICHGVHGSVQQALNELARISQWRPLELDHPLRIVSEVDQFEEGTDTLFDVPEDFARRRFAPRRVREEIPYEASDDSEGASGLPPSEVPKG